MQAIPIYSENELEAFGLRYVKPAPRRQRTSIWPIAGLAAMWAGILLWQAVRTSIAQRIA